jgi:hypothetical protein
MLQSKYQEHDSKFKSQNDHFEKFDGKLKAQDSNLKEFQEKIETHDDNFKTQENMIKVSACEAEVDGTRMTTRDKGRKQFNS